MGVINSQFHNAIDARSLASALGGEISGDQIRAPGPGHSKEDRSLSVRVDDRAPGGYVVHSFAGDDPITCKDYVREKAGLGAFKPNRQGRKHHPASSGAKRSIEATYDYRDESGVLRYQVVRLKPKSFRQRRPGGNDWIWNLDAVRRVLYRLPEILQYPDGTVFVCEGEKDADRVASLEHCATTVASGKWTEDCVKSLAGRDIIILQDNDDAGEKKALAAAQALHSVAKTIRIVLLPDLPPGGDVSDWLDADPERAGKLVDACFDVPEWSPASSAIPVEAATTSLQSARASSFEMKSIQWLWPGRYALGKLGLLVGLPDEGKGQVFCDMAARVTQGWDWPCGEGKAPKGNVILLTAEDDIGDTIRPRLVAAGADCDRVEIIKMVRASEKERMFSLVTDLDLLRKKIVEVGDVKLVQIDPITAYLGNGKVDSFRTTDVRSVLAPVVEFAADLRVSVVGIMHFNKKTDVDNALLRVSDSLAFGATARHVYAVVDDAENDRKLLVKAKNNLAAAGNKALAYHFGGREVGNDPESGETIFAPHILWEDQHVEVTATEAMQANTSKSPAARDEAKKFLADILANGPMVKAEIEEAAGANGISERTLFRAKGELGVMAKKDGPSGTWTWRLPEGAAKIRFRKEGEGCQ
jgi:5S rRNA maturation endonuclease (ribonuclease M5)